MATRLLVLVDAQDKTVANEEAMAAAGQEFKNLLEQVAPHFTLSSLFDVKSSLHLFALPHTFWSILSSIHLPFLYNECRGS